MERRIREKVGRRRRHPSRVAAPRHATLIIIIPTRRCGIVVGISSLSARELLIFRGPTPTIATLVQDPASRDARRSGSLVPRVFMTPDP